MKKNILPRLQLFELMVFSWFPAWLRRYQTDILLFSWRHFAPSSLLKKGNHFFQQAAIESTRGSLKILATY